MYEEYILYNVHLFGTKYNLCNIIYVEKEKKVPNIQNHAERYSIVDYTRVYDI